MNNLFASAIKRRGGRVALTAAFTVAFLSRLIQLVFELHLHGSMGTIYGDNEDGLTPTYYYLGEENAVLASLLADMPHPAMTCLRSHERHDDDDDTRQRRCCVSWEVNIDEWRTHHPDWHIVAAPSPDLLCLAKYDEPKATFFRNLYKLQWMAEVGSTDEQKNDQNVTNGSSKNGTDNIYRRTSLPPLRRNCTNILQTFQMAAGMGASISEVMHGLYSAHQRQRPYQLNKKRPDFRWLYAPTDNSSWAFCPNFDLSCYILPLGNCINTIGVSESKVLRTPRPPTEAAKWLRDYLTRFQQSTLWQIQNTAAKILGQPTASHRHEENCTAIHVRRSDAGMPNSPFRRYAPLSDYIDAGNISKDELILLLTDDQSTIYEAETFYPDYRWAWLERPRQNLTYGGFGGHIPSGDPAREFVNIFAEGMAAAKCHTLVHGKSGFVGTVQATRVSLGLPPAKEIKIDVDISKEEALHYSDKGLGIHKRAEVMLEKIYQDAAIALKQRKGNDTSSSSATIR